MAFRVHDDANVMQSNRNKQEKRSTAARRRNVRKMKRPTTVRSGSKVKNRIYCRWKMLDISYMIFVMNGWRIWTGNWRRWGLQWTCWVHLNYRERKHEKWMEKIRIRGNFSKWNQIDVDKMNSRKISTNYVTSKLIAAHLLCTHITHSPLYLSTSLHLMRSVAFLSSPREQDVGSSNGSTRELHGRLEMLTYSIPK